MELNRKTLNIRSFRKSLCNRVFSEGEVIVPDTKPDILRILSVRATPESTEAYVKNDKIIFSGNVRYNILYVGDIDRTRIYNIEYSSPFTSQSECNLLDENSKIVTVCFSEKTGYQIRNPRKISVSADIVFETEIVGHNEIEAIDGSEDKQCMVRVGECSYDNISVCNQVEIPVSETFTLPVGNDSVFELLDMNIKADVNEIRAVNNKAVIKGGGSVQLMCSSDGEIVTHENELSFTEISDFEGINSEMEISSLFSVSDCNSVVTQATDEVKIEISFILKGYVCAFEHQKFSYAQDIYNPDYSCENKTGEIKVANKSEIYSNQITVKDTALTESSDGGISKVYLMHCVCKCIDSQIIDTNININAAAYADVIYSDKDNALNCIKKVIPFKIEIPVDEKFKIGDTKVSLNLVNYGYTMVSDREIQFRIVVRYRSYIICEENVEFMTEFNINESEPLDKSKHPSIVVYYPGSGDDFWTIAKKYNTTCEEILKINSISGNYNTVPEKPILIPKTLL